MQPLTHVLARIFARGFYKSHSGLLVFLFVTLISYCFFINTAGDVKLLRQDEQIFYHFILLITFVSSPLMTGLFFVAWLVYTVKSYTYITGQLPIAHHQFIYYSSLSYSRLNQFKSWFYTQAIISLPFLLYAIVAAVTAVIFHHYLVILVIFGYALLLIAITAAAYVYKVSRLIDKSHRSWVFILSKYWFKPYFSLFVYYVFDKQKVTYVITKALCYLIIIGILFSFDDVRNDKRVAGLIILGIVTAHSLLIYQQHHFEQTYLSTVRNLPLSRVNLYLYNIAAYLILLSPEIIWIFITFNLSFAVALLLLMISLIELFNSVLYKYGVTMRKYLPSIFSLFFGLFLAILFGLIWLMIPLLVISSFLIFYFNYYKADINSAL